MIENTPFFSVIIPTHNRGLLMQRCVQSVIDQIYQNWEVIIIDDGSTDNTKEIVDSFDDIRISYLYQEHKERSI